ncbi:MAG: hypothetical protein HY433_02000 [Candidatus Liptonbacteria bacterium]|nr:hypothetical protein [Candidatus Liptonbacteria bacterium]
MDNSASVFVLPGAASASLQAGRAPAARRPVSLPAGRQVGEQIACGDIKLAPLR